MDMWTLWPLMTEALGEWAIDFFSSMFLFKCKLQIICQKAYITTPPLPLCFPLVPSKSNDTGNACTNRIDYRISDTP